MINYIPPRRKTSIKVQNIILYTHPIDDREVTVVTIVYKYIIPIIHYVMLQERCRHTDVLINL